MGEAAGLAAPELHSQSSAEWADRRLRMRPAVRRIVDRLYPPPPPGARLTTLESAATRDWLDRHGLRPVEIPAAYWGRLVRAVGRRTAGGQEGERP